MFHIFVLNAFSAIYIIYELHRVDIIRWNSLKAGNMLVLDDRFVLEFNNINLLTRPLALSAAENTSY